ncbi:hypothetical protein AKJ09_00580 [Labilithrix luteola]|uniref:Uncharacterized protein n=1 Tax=Labilithrix luteola TaxID=1391654 RepID=A0A0K1PKJ5_9BACT|nr:hypothetical protein AKJ09_00580 [Labilithrix luteola]
MLVTGPSLRDARQDALVVRYSANDEDVEKAIVSLTSQRVGGGTKTSLVDLGVDGVRGWQMHVGRLDRTFLRGPDHVLVVVPSRQAGAYARELQSGRLTVGPHDGQAAIALRAVKPTTWPFVPAGVIELRARVLLLSDDGTDTFVEADCADAATARIVAKQLEDRFQAAFPAKANGGPAIDTQSEGRTAKAHVRFAKDELESLLDFLGTWSDVEKSQ